MMLAWNDSTEQVDWNELAALYEVAPLGKKDPEKLEKAFNNSMFRCFVYDHGVLVGVGRALADGADCSYICDVAVLPSYQGIGLGKEIVGRLVELSQGHKKIILYAVPGKEGLYQNLGFKHMNTAMAIFQDEESAIERGLIK